MLGARREMGGGLWEEQVIEMRQVSHVEFKRCVIGLQETCRQRNSMGKGVEVGKLRVFCRTRI